MWVRAEAEDGTIGDVWVEDEDEAALLLAEPPAEDDEKPTVDKATA